jgi:hypothetical protein
VNHKLSSLRLLGRATAALAVGACSTIHSLGDNPNTGGAINVTSGGATNAASGGASDVASGGVTALGGAPGTGGTGSIGGAGNTSTSGGTLGSGGTVTGGNSAGGASPAACTDTLDAVRKSSFGDCPATLCEAQASATSCRPQTGSSTIGSCGTCGPSDYSNCYGFVRFDWGTHSKTCYYGGQSPNGRYERVTDLIGMMVSDDVPSYCNQTSYTLRGGDVPASCDGNASTRIDCAGSGLGGNGGSGSTNDAGQNAAPAALCYNNFNGTCQPCCSSNKPDCTEKPDGYPGYDCTPANGGWCSCNCEGGQWLCAC